MARPTDADVTKAAQLAAISEEGERLLAIAHALAAERAGAHASTRAVLAGIYTDLDEVSARILHVEKQLD